MQLLMCSACVHLFCWQVGFSLVWFLVYSGAFNLHRWVAAIFISGMRHAFYIHYMYICLSAL